MAAKSKGFDGLAEQLKNLSDHPEMLLAGQTLNIPQEVECEHCGTLQQIQIPTKIDRVEEGKGYGPPGSMEITCEPCGKPFEVTWDKVVIDITTK